MMRTLLLITTLAGLVSCGDPLVERPIEYGTDADIVGRPLGRMEFDGAERFIGDSDAAKAARLELLDVVMDRFLHVRQSLRRVSAGELPIDSLSGKLEAGDLTLPAQWFFEQMSATLVLESMVGTAGNGKVTAAPIPWHLPTASRCMSLLLRHRSPNAPLQALVLERLRGGWTPSEISAYATAASTHGLEWLERECGDCTREVVPVHRGHGQPGVEVARIRQGLADLARFGITG